MSQETGLAEAEARARASALAALQTPGADDIEIVTVASDTGLTRFARSEIIQNTVRAEARAHVRVVVGDRWASSTTNQLTPQSVGAAVKSAVEAAEVSPSDPEFPGLPAPTEVGRPQPLGRYDLATAECSPARRGEAVRAVLAATGSDNAAGYVETSAHALTINSSTGIDCRDSYTRCAVQCLVDNGDSTGWGEAYSHALEQVDGEAVAGRARLKAEAGADAAEAAPGTYEVVLEPSAVATLLDYLSYVGFGAKQVIEGESFLATRAGDMVAAPAVTVADDVFHPRSIGLGFDFEGVPRTRVAVIDAGRATAPVTDRRTARQLGIHVTGHFSGSNEFGPYASNPILHPGDASLETLVAGVADGLLVTRFHYVNVLDRPKTLLTGMTRDGTFRIRSGEVAEPVQNFRFAQTALGALQAVQGIGRDLDLFAESFGSTLAPALRVGAFSFASTTSH